MVVATGLGIGYVNFKLSQRESNRESTEIKQSGPIGSAFDVIEAERSGWVGRRLATMTTDGATYVAPLLPGDAMRFDGVDFGTSAATEVVLRFRTTRLVSDGGRVTLRLDSPTGEMMSELRIGHNKDEPSLITTKAPFFRGITGTHTVYVIVSGTVPGEILQLDWVQFRH